ncbi:hypothetical protein MIND_00997800 [Mycena indigotica]|uniref:F-box domain-containing protein n=1 Tax=Mycena indigotica TaxID=2126181 RepID=A0A8H6SA69_9AGAR|nr:uncharacterized protein MIND_00997800 [Mycena indigotica]KAF7294612.1 hypothetical protein MIND_00997800 [Mycena indigotica]
MINFSSLPTELIYEILTQHCDIRSLNCISQTCKPLHTLVTSKAVWVSVIKRLKSHGFIDERFAREPSQLSTAELSKLVKRLVHGPDSWQSAQGQTTISPRISSCITLHTPCDHPTGYSVVRFVPGGHLLRNNHGTTELWDVEHGQKVWFRAPQIPNITLVQSGFERKSSGVVVVAMTYVDSDNFTFNLEMAELMVYREPQTTETSHLHLEINLTNVTFGPVRASVPVMSLCEDLVLLNIGIPGYLLVNWREKSAIALDPGGLEQLDWVLTPHGDIIAIMGSYEESRREDPVQLKIFDTNAFELVPIGNNRLIDHIPLSTVVPLLTHQFARDLANRFEVPYALYIFPDPLEEGSFRLWACVYQQPPDLNLGTAALLHQLSLTYTAHNGQRLLPTLTHSNSAEPHRISRPDFLYANSMGFSGHAQVQIRPRSLGRIRITDSYGGEGETTLSEVGCDGGGFNYMAPYCGSWAYVKDHQTTVIDFE